MGGAITGGELNDAKTVAMRAQTKRFAVYGDGPLECHGSRQVALMDGDFC